jgi:branched-chain amino acid transport system ATP-binding protein
VLEVRGLDVRYGHTHAVRGVDLDVGAGEIVAVLGANGAGKSSLLKAILGEVAPAAGSVRFEGADITRAPIAARIRSGLTLVPEGRRILVSMTVHENLLVGAYPRTDKRSVRADTDAIYERFPNLAARRDALAAVLSGGEQQMLAIGRALMTHPRLLMLDEPSLGLSPLLVERLFALIAELNADGIAILIVEQNTTHALRLASHASVLELGRTVMAGPASELAHDERLASAYLG